MDHDAASDDDMPGIRFDPSSSCHISGNNHVVDNPSVGITMSADLSGCRVYGNVFREKDGDEDMTEDEFDERWKKGRPA